jgi:hypothetical protein
MKSEIQITAKDLLVSFLKIVSSFSIGYALALLSSMPVVYMLSKISRPFTQLNDVIYVVFFVTYFITLLVVTFKKDKNSFLKMLSYIILITGSILAVFLILVMMFFSSLP